jgi:hypothetical protein
MKVQPVTIVTTEHCTMKAERGNGSKLKYAMKSKRQKYNDKDTHKKIIWNSC